MSQSFKNILIIKPSSLGDIILVLPALSALRGTFPDAKISWLIKPEFAAVLENHPHINDIILFDRKFLGKAWSHPRALSSLLSLIKLLRRSKFDAVFDLQGLFRTASLAWLTGCKKRFGMANARELAHIFYTHKVPQNYDCIHLVDFYMKIVQAAGVSNTDVRFVLPQDPVAADSINKLLESEGITHGNYAVFVPSSARLHKCWPVERFAALAEKISSQFGFSIVATATASERAIVDQLSKIAKVPIINLAGRTSISELIALMRAARLIVSNDTGPGHIAAASAKPMVMLFGRTNPARVAPYRRDNCIVAVEPDSRGLKADSSDPKHNIEAITIDEVFQKVCEQLNL